MKKISKWNKGYKYLLMVIDVFSKYGWIVPLKDKRGETVTKNSRNICGLIKVKNCTKNMNGLLNKHNVTLYSTENEEKSCVVERWNRRIKTKMWRHLTIQGNTQYLDMLSKLVKEYNNTKNQA